MLFICFLDFCEAYSFVKTAFYLSREAFGEKKLFFIFFYFFRTLNEKFLAGLSKAYFTIAEELF